MRVLRWLTGVWRGASFSIKFAIVILIAGTIIAVVPLLTAQADTRSEAVDRAADKAGVAGNLITGQRQSLTAFVNGVARQVAAAHQLGDPQALTATLAQDAGVNQGYDVVLGVLPVNGRVLAVHGKAQLPAGTLTTTLEDAVVARATTAATADGQPWLLSSAKVPNSDVTVFVARPMDAAFIAAIAHNLATSADPAELAVVRGGHFAAGGTVAGRVVSGGEVPTSALLQALASATPAIVTFDSGPEAVATYQIGNGFAVMVTTPVNAITTSLQPILILIGLILVSMLFIVVVVQTDLQRPLRRLDRAVAALGRGEFDAPVTTGSDDELSRLGTTFEAMRRQLQATIRATAARAAVATELAAAQPLETLLSRVCHEMRTSLLADVALIVVTGSETDDGFAIVEGAREFDHAAYLSGDGPLAEGYRHPGAGAVLLGAAPSSLEAQLGVREFCVAPLRIGTHMHGVLAVAKKHESFLTADVDVVSITAEQVALALERHRFLAVVQRQASIDDLTGLYNHRFLVDYLGQQVALAERLNAPLAILMIDIDHFKNLNDRHGHQAGDAALAAFAQTLVSSVRRSDLAARYGGEEFSVVMANTSAAEARLVAEKIRRNSGHTRIELPDGDPVALTVSIGGAAFPENTDNARELLRLADESLYRAKRTGRNRTCMSGEGSRRRTQRSVVSVVHTPGSVEPGRTVGASEHRRSAQ